MNNIQLFTIAGGIAAICVATGAASNLDADTGQESRATQGDQMSRRQIWNYAIANAEGFNFADQSAVESGPDKIANGR